MPTYSAIDQNEPSALPQPDDPRYIGPMAAPVSPQKHAPAAPFETAPALAALPGVRHGFFGRRGGVSSGVYLSLNARLGSADNADAVTENRARIAATLGVEPARLLSAHQVHSPRSVIVEGPWTGPPPHADAVVTATPGLAVAVATADCAPVLLADPRARVIAAAHAGWRGALDGVLEAAVLAMETLGADRGRIIAAIGPCISQAAYEVGPEFKARFLAQSPTHAPLFRDGDKTHAEGERSHFDLPGYVIRRLAHAGVTRVDALPFCTVADPDAWFSHRRAVKRGEPDYGCNLSAITLRS